MITKKELKQIPYLDRRIDSMRKELERLKELSTCIKSFNSTEDKIKTSKVKDPMKIVDKIVDLESEIKAEVDRLIALKKEVRELFDSLDDREKLLMELRYIKRTRWNDIARIMVYDRQYIENLHGKILKKIFNS